MSVKSLPTEELSLPFKPGEGLAVRLWRGTSARVVITVVEVKSSHYDSARISV
ncbi:MAG TPA: hypothetical protein VFV34_03435 [Blastocatellia bacterium]|nr:hypothetical protein [Blastocatellia bacterium]